MGESLMYLDGNTFPQYVKERNEKGTPFLVLDLKDTNLRQCMICIENFCEFDTRKVRLF